MENSYVGNNDETEIAVADIVQPSEAKQKRIWTCFVYLGLGVFVAVALQAVMAGILAATMLGQGLEPDELGQKLIERIMQPDMFILTILLGQFGFALATFGPAFLSKESFVERFGYRSVSQPFKLYTYVLTGSIFVLALAIGLVYLVSLVITPDESIMKFFESVTPGWGILFVLVIAIFPGFIEETMFRGYIQQRFMSRWKPAKAIAVSSILFGLAHVTPHAIAVALPLGVWFGIIAWKTNSIWPSIACHMFVNGGLNVWRLVCKFAGISESTANVFHVIFVVIGLVGFVLACRLLFEQRNDGITAQPSPTPVASR